MKIRIQIITPDEAEQLVDNFSNLTYAKEFFDFKEKHYHLKSGFLKIYKGDAFFGLIPINYNGKEVYSVFKDYTEPYFATIDHEIDWHEVAQATKKIINFKYCEFKFVFVNNELSKFGSLKLTALSDFVLRINRSREDFFKKFNQKMRNVRKAEKSNFKTRIVGKEMLDEVYALYKENMKRHGTPPKPIEFFRDLFFCFKEKCKVLAVFDGDSFVGANIMQINDKYLRMAFNLSKTEYWPYRINDLLYYKMIEFAYNNGIEILDLGLGVNTDIGHNKFKMNYGAEKKPVLTCVSGSFLYFIKKWVNQKYFNFKIVLNKICKHLPQIKRKS